jgi:NitT/TauT family transport system permease protein
VVSILNVVRDGLYRYLPLILIALAWEALARSGWVNELALPPLTTIVGAWLGLIGDGELVTNGASSLYRAGAGLGLAIVLGGALGIFMAWSKPVLVFIGPLVELFYPLPKSALIPVCALWLGFGDMSKIVLIFLGCLLPVTLGAFNGARGADQELLWSARGMGATKLEVLWDVVLPSAMPELLNGIRTALALSFVLLVSSELIVARAGFGYMIGNLGSAGVYDAMFAVVLTVAFLGFAADRSYQAFQRRVLLWRE